MNQSFNLAVSKRAIKPFAVWQQPCSWSEYEHVWSCRDKPCRLLISFECREWAPRELSHRVVSHRFSSRTARRHEEGWMTLTRRSCRRDVLALSCFAPRVLCWLFVSTTDLPAEVKPYTSQMHWINSQVSGHCVVNAKAHNTVAACLPLCAQHSAVPRLHTLQELDLWFTFNISSMSHLLFLLLNSRRFTFLWHSGEVNLEARRHTLWLHRLTKA